MEFIARYAISSAHYFYLYTRSFVNEIEQYMLNSFEMEFAGSYLTIA